MEHRNAGAYALVGALALSCGFTMGFVASKSDGPKTLDNGCVPVTEFVDEEPIDADAGIGAYQIQNLGPDGMPIRGTDSGMTVRIVIDDRRGDSRVGGQDDGGDASIVGSPMGGPNNPPAPHRPDVMVGSPMGGPKGAAAVGSAGKSVRDSSSPNANSEKATETRVEPKKPVEVSDSQVDALNEALRERLGKEAVVSSVSCGSWDGGKKNRLDVIGYASGAEFSSVKDLSESFGGLMADLAKTADSDFKDIELMSVRIFGVDDVKDGLTSDDVPSAEEADWIVSANVDIPSSDGKSVGDVNRAVVVYDGKLGSIDLTGHGFSDLPQEE